MAAPVPVESHTPRTLRIATDMHYLDANATQPLRPEARAALLAALDVTGNPSSVHRPGRAVRRMLEDAREALAESFDAKADGVIFTSGGSEADALAIHTLAPAPLPRAASNRAAPRLTPGWDALATLSGSRRRIVISAIEHDAVRAATDDPVLLPVGSDCVVDLDALAARLNDGVPSLVCLMLANNETGVVQPVARAAALCRRHGAVLHVDAVQAAGRIPVSLHALGCHSLAISSHKLGGPAGVGALLLAEDAPFSTPLLAGGGQEHGRRGGTPSAALAAAFAAAAVTAAFDDMANLSELRDAAEAAAVACGAVVCGAAAPRLPNTTCLALPGVRADAQVIALDLEHVAVSAGAACSSGKVTTSHVLLAMGLGPLASCAIRVSLPWNATVADIDAFASAYARTADRLRPALVPAPL